MITQEQAMTIAKKCLERFLDDLYVSVPDLESGELAFICLCACTTSIAHRMGLLEQSTRLAAALIGESKQSGSEG